MKKTLVLAAMIAALCVAGGKRAKADILPSAAFETSSSFCRDREYAAHVWLQSDHGKRREGQQKLNEKNYGLGLKVTCDDLFFVHVDKLKNSQWGYTDLAMIGITQKWYPFDKNGFHLQVSLGEVYLKYRVPRLNASASGHSRAGYLGIGYGPLTLQVAPVPKQKGVYIAFLQASLPF